MIPRGRERLGGAFIACAGAALTWYVWQVAHIQHSFPRIGVAAPAFAVLGLALLLFPGYRSERVARGEDISGLEGFSLLTARWKVVLGVALAASLGFYVWLGWG